MFAWDEGSEVCDDDRQTRRQQEGGMEEGRGAEHGWVSLLERGRDRALPLVRFANLSLFLPRVPRFSQPSPRV